MNIYIYIYIRSRYAINAVSVYLEKDLSNTSESGEKIIKNAFTVAMMDFQSDTTTEDVSLNFGEDERPRQFK